MLKELMIFCVTILLKVVESSSTLKYHSAIAKFDSILQDIKVVISNDVAVVKYDISQNKEEKLVFLTFNETDWTKHEPMSFSAKGEHPRQLTLSDDKLVITVGEQVQVYYLENNNVKSGPHHLIHIPVKFSDPVLFKNDLLIHQVDNEEMLYYQLEHNETSRMKTNLIQTFKPPANVMFKTGHAIFNTTALVNARTVADAFWGDPELFEVLEYSLVDGKWSYVQSIVIALNEMFVTWSVALSSIDGSLFAAVAASTGRVYLYEKTSGAWTLRDQINIADGDILSAAMSENNLLVVVCKDNNCVVQHYSISN